MREKLMRGTNKSERGQGGRHGMTGGQAKSFLQVKREKRFKVRGGQVLDGWRGLCVLADIARADGRIAGGQHMAFHRQREEEEKIHSGT